MLYKAVNGTPSHSYVVSLAMGSHITWHKWTPPP